VRDSNSAGHVRLNKGRREGKREGIPEIVKLAGSNIVTLFGAYLMFASAGATNDTTMLSTVLQRLKVVEEHNHMFSTQLVLKGVENVKLREQMAELRGELKSNITRSGLYQSFLDSLPFPAWIKIKEPDGKFRMVMINDAYVHQFGISKARYQGSTDAELWSAEVARGFTETDEEVFKSKGYVLAKELFPVNGKNSKLAWHSVWKFSVLIGKEKYGVGGIVVIDFVNSEGLEEQKRKIEEIRKRSMSTVK
tara:strand:+ start:4888 stop:5637 length:750 start_codon:yes stop_codon:yes gene_type:complete